MCPQATVISPDVGKIRLTVNGTRIADGTSETGGKSMRGFHDEKGKIGYIILWFLGVPASILILIFLLRGCT